MPLYVYRCDHGCTFDARVPLPQRDASQPCPQHPDTSGRRVFGAGHQRPVIRAAGYSLKPGDRGYWNFETPQGRAAPWQQKQIAPFAAAEDFYKHPPKPVADDDPDA
jgi:hypothetical protein